MKTVVDLPTRIFHILLIIFIAAAALTDETAGAKKWHILAGLFVFALVIFRIFWGFAGSKYAAWRGFFKHEAAGHHKNSKPFVIAVLVILTGICASGLAYWLLKDGYFGEPQKLKWLKEIHELLFNALLLAIGAHIIGVAVDFWKTKNAARATSMLDGRRACDKEWAQGSTLVGLGVLGLFIAAAFGFWVWAHKPVIQAPAWYVKACGECHPAYHPSALRGSAWQNMMGNLENHFGDDATLSQALHEQTLGYLLKNSAELNVTKLSLATAIKMPEDTDAPSKTEVFKKIHKHVPKERFKSKEVKSAANCTACHEDALNGDFRLLRIK